MRCSPALSGATHSRSGWRGQVIGDKRSGMPPIATSTKRALACKPNARCKAARWFWPWRAMGPSGTRLLRPGMSIPGVMRKNASALL